MVPRWLSVEVKRVHIFGGKFKQPVRLVQLSDLHYSWFVSSAVISHAFHEALNQKPDLICLSGDFVTAASWVDLNALASLLKELSDRVPVYAVKGNHDGRFWARSYMGENDETGVEETLRLEWVKLMKNRAELVLVQGGEFWLTEVWDLWSQDSCWRASGVTVHNPDTKDALTGQSWDLFIAGLLRWEEQERWIHVNRSVANLMGFRVLLRPELSVLELV